MKLNFSNYFCKGIILKGETSDYDDIPSCILSQYLRYNENIQVDKASAHFSKFSEKFFNYISRFFSDSGSFKN